MVGILNLIVIPLLSVADMLPPEPLVIEGRTMGTTYRVVYFDEPRRRDYGQSVDSLLILVNKAISNYDPSSEISRFNASKNGIRFQSVHLREILKVAKCVYEDSGGAFDPTIMPLVNAWGFGPQQALSPSPELIDSLRNLVGFDKVRVKRRKLKKTDPRVQLDMGGIGQGYGADVIIDFLRAKGIQHALVELGGEGVAVGHNLKNDRKWTIGILDPNSTQDRQFFKAYVELPDLAYTTSGNYFNYKVIDGRRYGHTIDPATGYPVQHSLLSASVFSERCTIADAWATAFMVMGTRKAIAMVNSQPGLDAMFLYADENGDIQVHLTPRMRDLVIIE